MSNEELELTIESILLTNGMVYPLQADEIANIRAELTKLIDEETTKARISEIENVINMPVEFDDFDIYLPYRLTELKERENSNA